MSEESHSSLKGSCSCGRNNYIVVLPAANRVGEAGLRFLTDSEHRRSSSSLLSSYLRVPLRCYSSQTIAFFPDETHSSISRTFYPHHEPHAQRKFCGYCGTHLSFWSEHPRGEEDYVYIAVGSLHGESLEALEDLGVLESDDEEAIEESTSQQISQGQDEHGGQMHNTESRQDSSSIVTRTTRHGTEGPMTWFEEMIDGSRLGRISQTRRGFGKSADGSMTVTWEVEEYGTDNDDKENTTADHAGSAASSSKRKIGEVADEDIAMKGQ